MPVADGVKVIYTLLAIFCGLIEIYKWDFMPGSHNNLICFFHSFCSLKKRLESRDATSTSPSIPPTPAPRATVPWSTNVTRRSCCSTVRRIGKNVKEILGNWKAFTSRYWRLLRVNKNTDMHTCLLSSTAQNVTSWLSLSYWIWRGYFAVSSPSFFSSLVSRFLVIGISLTYRSSCSPALQGCQASFLPGPHLRFILVCVSCERLRARLRFLLGFDRHLYISEAA